LKDEGIEEDLQQLRVQARSKAIVLIASLILIFLWFTDISWVTAHETFSTQAMAAFSRAIGMGSSYYIIPITFIVTILYTLFYIILIKVLVSSSLKSRTKS
jgi:hypothetical protein